MNTATARPPPFGPKANDVGANFGAYFARGLDIADIRH